MKINNQINSLNTNQNLRQNPNFKSIIPIKVFIDDAPTVDKKNISKAVRILSKLLFDPFERSEKALEFRQIFSKYDRDYKNLNLGEEKGKLLRTRLLDGISYLFTGPQAGSLDELGRKIGPAKSKGLDTVGTTKTFEAKLNSKSYFAKIQEFIDLNVKARIKEAINPDSGAYEGNEIGLHIITKSQGQPGTKNFKLKIEKIVFRKIKKAEPVKEVEEAKVTATKNSSAKTQEGKSKKVKADWPAVAQDIKSEEKKPNFVQMKFDL